MPFVVSRSHRGKGTWDRHWTVSAMIPQPNLKELLYGYAVTLHLSISRTLLRSRIGRHAVPRALRDSGPNCAVRVSARLSPTSSHASRFEERSLRFVRFPPRSTRRSNAIQ